MADTHILKYGFLAALSLSAAVFLPFDGGLKTTPEGAAYFYAVRILRLFSLIFPLLELTMLHMVTI